MFTVSRKAIYHWKEVVPGDKLCHRQLTFRAIVPHKDMLPERSWCSELYFIPDAGSFFQSKVYPDGKDKKPKVVEWLPDMPSGWTKVFEDEGEASRFVDINRKLLGGTKETASWGGKLWMLEYVEFQFEEECEGVGLAGVVQRRGLMEAVRELDEAMADDAEARASAWEDLKFLITGGQQ